MRALIFLATFGLLTSIYTYNWEPTDAYTIKFSTEKAEGTFTDLQGTIEFTADDIANANFDVSVATLTINTANETKDKHAFAASWSDPQQSPRINLQSLTLIPSRLCHTPCPL